MVSNGILICLIEGLQDLVGVGVCCMLVVSYSLKMNLWIRF